jgi:SpoVK/Ycf46/Vps4 family AAA+-type ATPase
VRIALPLPPEGDREQVWRRCLGSRARADELAAIAARYPISPGLIERAARSGLMLAGDRSVRWTDVQRAVSAELAERFRGIGRRVVKSESWDDLVLPDETLDAVKELLSRVRNRRLVLDDWGFGDKLAKGLGVSALFSGEPGTGKTMVAALIAADLGLELYQIDLSTLVSKYIGETEKNLARAFDAAESGHAILLFDEADSLFGKRTEVKSSTDRYANMEVNYLLQRLEQFQGVAILTTNMTASVDDAFVRRLSVHLRFELPEEAERERLWRAMFPSRAPRSDDIDFAALARRYEFSGGHIRNAVLRAAYLAGAEDAAINGEHLRRAADLEAQEMGRVTS